VTTLKRIENDQCRCATLRRNYINTMSAPVRGTSADAVFPALDAVWLLDGTGHRHTRSVATWVVVRSVSMTGTGVTRFSVNHALSKYGR